jgi:hypothetical protein
MILNKALVDDITVGVQGIDSVHGRKVVAGSAPRQKGHRVERVERARPKCKATAQCGIRINRLRSCLVLEENLQSSRSTICAERADDGTA